MKRGIIFLGLILIYYSARAQTVLLNVDQGNEQKISESGQNLKRFSHLYIRAAFLASKDEPGARIIYGSSVNLAFGLRKKYKIGSVYSLGFDIEGQFTYYKLKQESGKILPDTIINKASRLDYSSLGLGFYNRFNFDPERGNFLGTYFDLGIMGEFHYSINSLSKNNLPDGPKLKSVIRNLQYVNNLNAKAYTRFGFGHFSLYASYRFSELFKSLWNYPDLPRVIVGVELAIF